ncbi:MAG: hypothetical protein ACT452_06920 [Microthrixaceae bacterium]
MGKLLVVLMTGVLLLAACGGDDKGGGSGGLSAEEQGFVDDAMDGFDAEEAAPITEEDATCMVESFVANLGVDRLDELEITPADFASNDESFPSGLTTDEAAQVVDGFDGCIDLANMFLDSLAQDETMSAEARACLAKAFDGAAVERIFVTLLTDGEDALTSDKDFMAEMTAVVSTCPEAFSG